MERSPSATMRSRQAIRSDMVSSLTSICKMCSRSSGGMESNFARIAGLTSVSYTHLDVYKRQPVHNPEFDFDEDCLQAAMELCVYALEELHGMDA